MPLYKFIKEFFIPPGLYISIFLLISGYLSLVLFFINKQTAKDKSWKMIKCMLSLGICFCLTCGLATYGLTTKIGSDKFIHSLEYKYTNKAIKPDAIILLGESPYRTRAELALWKVQERTYDNLYRYDLVCRIKDGSVSGFWKTIEQFFNSKYVIFEFKNYKEQITQREIYTTEKYLYLKALRGVAIIISCYGTDNNAEKAIRGTLRENGKLILSVNNQGLIEMIEAKNKGRDPSGL